MLLLDFRSFAAFSKCVFESENPRLFANEQKQTFTLFDRFLPPRNQFQCFLMPSIPVHAFFPFHCYCCCCFFFFQNWAVQCQMTFPLPSGWGASADLRSAGKKCGGRIHRSFPFRFDDRWRPVWISPPYVVPRTSTKYCGSMLSMQLVLKCNKRRGR